MYCVSVCVICVCGDWSSFFFFWSVMNEESEAWTEAFIPSSLSLSLSVCQLTLSQLSTAAPHKAMCVWTVLDSLYSMSDLTDRPASYLSLSNVFVQTPSFIPWRQYFHRDHTNSYTVHFKLLQQMNAMQFVCCLLFVLTQHSCVNKYIKSKMYTNLNELCLEESKSFTSTKKSNLYHLHLLCI